jgi:hypothetical protein
MDVVELTHIINEATATNEPDRIRQLSRRPNVFIPYLRASLRVIVQDREGGGGKGAEEENQ